MDDGGYGVVGGEEMAKEKKYEIMKDEEGENEKKKWMTMVEIEVA